MRWSVRPVFRAIDDSVSPDLTVYVRARPLRRFAAFERLAAVRARPLDVVVADGVVVASPAPRPLLTME